MSEEIKGVSQHSGGGNQQQFQQGQQRKKEGPPTKQLRLAPRDMYIAKEKGRVASPSYGNDPRLKKLMNKHVLKAKTNSQG